MLPCHIVAVNADHLLQVSLALTFLLQRVLCIFHTLRHLFHGVGTGGHIVFHFDGAGEGVVVVAHELEGGNDGGVAFAPGHVGATVGF
jgi:hypothetical protein